MPLQRARPKRFLISFGAPPVWRDVKRHERVPFAVRLLRLEICRLTIICLCLFVANALFACGPDFPNTLLDGGDTVLLSAPVADFSRELERMKLGPPRFVAVIPTNSYNYLAVGRKIQNLPKSETEISASSYIDQTLEAELSDLRTALKRAKTPVTERDRILEEYGAERRKLNSEAQALGAWENYHDWDWVDGERKEKPKPAKPEWKEVKIVAGVPDEFADYLKGCIAYYRDETNEARNAWEGLLARPKAERHFRSTWAAYMLGRLCDTNELDKAIDYYTQVRKFAKEGFADTLGLAAASLGWEAQVNLQQKQFEHAIELYLQQYAAGDFSAVNSLRFAARDAISADPETLEELAKNSTVRKVITSFVIAHGYRQWNDAGSKFGEQEHGPLERWLEALETEGVTDVDSAEELALAAYQNDEMEVAQRWINRSRNSPVARWLQAKLFLRSGKIDRAAALLRTVSHEFPITTTTNETPPNSLADSLYMNFSGYWPEQRPIANQVLGELGALRLSRREYEESLDALLRSGYWMDAAYVAERVLTLDELKGYVDRQWPAELVDETTATNAATAYQDGYFFLSGYEQLGTNQLRSHIRYLLGRRLTRLSRGAEARDYFPTKYLASYDNLMRTLDAGHDESLPAEARADALFKAATIARYDGMELIGTEVAPDWHIAGGNYEFEMTAQKRATNEDAKLVPPAKDEVDRYSLHTTDPDLRFHYRYQAAAIALEASRLLPNNSDLTARILCTAGSWLKYKDPKTADILYKLLVRRCRKTPLGAEADRKRWFPELDEQGNMVAAKPPGPPPEESSSPDMTEPPAIDAAPVQDDRTQPVPAPSPVEVPQAGTQRREEPPRC